MALFGPDAMSSLSPLCARKRTFASRSSLWVHALDDGESSYPFKSPTLKSYQLNDLTLGVLVSVDVSLGDAQARMSSQHLYVPE